MSNPNLRLNRLNNTIRKKGESGAQIYEKNKKTVVLSSDRNIIFDTDGGQLSIQDGGYPHFLFDCDATALTIYDDTNSDDGATITVAANGVTTITTNDNDGTSGHLVLSPDGNVGIGTASPTAPLHVQVDPGDNEDVCLIRNTRSSPDANDIVLGLSFSADDASNAVMVKFTDGNHTLGNINVIDASGTAIQYATSSDYRMKENATSISDALTRINRLKPYRLNYIGNSNTIDSFFAHEVMEVLPYAGSGTKDEMYPEGHIQHGQIKPQQLSYGAMVPILVACIQELSAKVTALENA